MKKVLLVSPKSGVVGGIMRWTNHIYEWYFSIPESERNFKLSFFDFGRKIAGQLVESKIRKVICAGSEYIILIYRACKTIHVERPDVVHITSPGSFLLIKDYILLRYAHKLGCTTIIHYRFGRIPELFMTGGRELKLLRKVMDLADRIVVIDRRSYDVLKKVGYKKLYLIPNPVSADVIELESRFRRIRDSRTVLFAGHVIPTKGVSELVEVCRDIHNIKLVIVGAVSEKYKCDLISIAGFDFESWLEFKGEMDYVSTISEMCRCSLFALPTYTEGFPNVILEAMACAMPIVTCPVGAIPEMLDSGDGTDCGIMVPPKDTIALHDAISKMLDDDEFSRLCGKKAKAKVLENYTMTKIFNQLEEIWMR